MLQHGGERSFEEHIRQRAAEDSMIIILTDFNELDHPENLHYRAVKNGRTLHEWNSEPVEGEVVEEDKK